MTDHARKPARATLRDPADLLARLRRDTADAHDRLEAELDLLRRPLDRRRMLHVLERFYGFHAVWEGAMRRSSIGPFFEARRRMAHLTADLTAMGLGPNALNTLPLCAAAARLAGTRESAVGALYVMEGSTLGGQVISKALADADWLPPGGIAYFNPYAERTGAMWRSFRDWAQMTTPFDTHAAVSAGAVNAFETLHAWMVEERA